MVQQQVRTQAKSAKNRITAAFSSYIGRDYRERRRRAERLALLFTLLFAGGVVLVAWYTEGEVFRRPWEVVMSFGAEGRASRNAAINCTHPKNKNTPYCQNRQATADAEWHGMSRYHKGQANPFTLHGR